MGFFKPVLKSSEDFKNASARLLISIFGLTIDQIVTLTRQYGERSLKPEWKDPSNEFERNEYCRELAAAAILDYEAVEREFFKTSYSNGKIFKYGRLTSKKSSKELADRLVEFIKTTSKFYANQIDAMNLVEEGSNFCLNVSFELALKSFNKAIVLDPKNTKALSNKAAILGNLGRFEEAIESCNVALEANSGNANAWYAKGKCLGNLNRLSEELNCYDKAIEADPKFFQAVSNKAFCLNMFKRYEEAIECCNLSIKLSP